MLRRSQSANGAAALALANQSRARQPTRSPPKKHPEFIGTSETQQALKLGKVFHTLHGYPARPEQIQYGYIPLDVNHPKVAEEIRRQEAAGMPPCDCSTCRPDEAEALWQAQAALTTENFDQALAMCASDLDKLAKGLPDLPPPPASQPKSVAVFCGAQDEIRTSTLLVSLVSAFESGFASLFHQTFKAWDLAKNIDIITTPSDMALILVSEMIPGQFDTLFRCFTQWQVEFDTAATIAEARANRLATSRPNGPILTPVSVEGAQILKCRSDAHKLALKETREQLKQQALSTKAAERAQRAQDKLNATELAARLALEAKAKRAQEKLEAASEAKRLAMELKAQKKEQRILAAELAKQEAALARAEKRSTLARRESGNANGAQGSQAHLVGPPAATSSKRMSETHGEELDYLGQDKRGRNSMFPGMINLVFISHAFPVAFGC
ncbi:uncharacterized protein MELLADRAFT_110473 [Melampsora larici-populina 98AG31]|uniref:Uncharacterized protein n=1 Tax=Melampsora larici-populina (strain 98AG31 / pathotype 3-4-7) TaxID=747676 RepID=F4RZX4_MELLP|nr:uncharacterized protein MELLADRAFT_110473 [Melampsora larici-populina 98AG31]EGG02113.1 hypothetical protein MELLADRAFT_110473 [Melampsora larici-populina 98AG31]